VDWLDNEFWAPSVNVGVQKRFTLFPETLDIPVTVFGLTGAIVPVAGAGTDNGEVGALAGTGFSATIWRPTPNSALSLFYGAEYWSNLDQWVHRPGVAFTLRF
jgi:hypothetical protein